MNMAATKGMTLNHTLIFPTPAMNKWLINHDSKLAPRTRATLYVALTRAKYSVAFLVPKDFHLKCPIKKMALKKYVIISVGYVTTLVSQVSRVT